VIWGITHQWTVDCGGCTVDEEPGLVRLRTQPPGNPVVITIRGR
jgi:hypothetical protein